jgi:hypothetical protein
MVNVRHRTKKILIITYLCGFIFFLVVFSIPDSPGWLVWVSLGMFLAINIAVSFFSLKVFMESMKSSKY